MRKVYWALLLLIFNLPTLKQAYAIKNDDSSWEKANDGSIQNISVHKNDVFKVTLKESDGTLLLSFRHHIAPERQIRCDEFNANIKSNNKYSQITLNDIKFDVYTLCQNHEGNNLGSFLYIVYLDELPEGALNHFAKSDDVNISLYSGEFIVTTKNFTALMKSNFKDYYSLKTENASQSNFPLHTIKTDKPTLIDKQGNALTINGEYYEGKSVLGFSNDKILNLRGYLKSNFYQEQTIIDDSKYTDLNIQISKEFINLWFKFKIKGSNCDYKGRKVSFNHTTTYLSSRCDDKVLVYSLRTSNKNHKIIEEFKSNDVVIVKTLFDTFYFDTSNFQSYYSQIEKDITVKYSPLKLDCYIDFDKRVNLTFDVDLLATTVNNTLAVISENNIKFQLADAGIVRISRYTSKLEYYYKEGFYTGHCKKLERRIF